MSPTSTAAAAWPRRTWWTPAGVAGVLLLKRAVHLARAAAWAVAGGSAIVINRTLPWFPVVLSGMVVALLAYLLLARVVPQRAVLKGEAGL